MTNPAPDPPKAVEPVPFPRFRDEVLARYAAKSASAAGSMRRALSLAEILNVATTADLTPEFLDRFKAALSGKGRKERTVAQLLALLSTACNLAVSWGYLGASPFAGRPALARWMNRAAHTPPRPAPTPEAVRAHLARLEADAGNDLVAHRALVMARLVAATGLTRREATRMRVSDVDLKAATIRAPGPAGDVRALDMPPDLARTLRGWLLRPVLPANSKLDDSQAAEARRLRTEGWSVGKLAERYGVAEETIRGLLAGRNWRHVPGECVRPSRVADQEWLFPSFRPGDSGPSGGDDDHKRAGEAGGLSLTDLRRYYQEHVAPGSMIDPPRDPAPPVHHTSCPVRLSGLERAVYVRGRRKPRLTPARYNVLKVLVDAWPDGVTKFELEERSGHWTAAVKILRGLKRLDEDYDAVIALAGRNYREGYRLTDPGEARARERSDESDHEGHVLDTSGSHHDA